MITKFNEFVILDTEFTAWEGSQYRNWSKPDEFREIVQISAIKIKNLDIVKSINIYITPTRNPLLSKYFTQLTGITNEYIQKHGIEFDEAMEQLYEFCGVSTPIYSYGNDWDVIEENLYLNKITAPKFVNWKPDWHDVCHFFMRYGINTKRYTSGTIYKITNKQYTPSVHNAIWDSLSIFIAIKYLLGVL